MRILRAAAAAAVLLWALPVAAYADTAIDMDYNGDGAVDGFDMALSDKVINSFAELSGSYYEASDMNSDGVIDVLDYGFIESSAVGIF